MKIKQTNKQTENRKEVCHITQQSFLVKKFMLKIVKVRDVPKLIFLLFIIHSVWKYMKYKKYSCY